MKRSTSRLYIAAATAAKSLQSCLTQCDPVDSSPPGSPIPGILQERTLEWVASSFSYAWKWKVRVKSLSHVWFLATPWTGAYQAPPSMGFSRQEYWSGVPLPSPNPVYWCLINDFLKHQPRRSGDVQEMKLLLTCHLCHGALSDKCYSQSALWNMCLSFHRELKEKIQPEILELIKQQRLNRLVEGTCFRKLNCRRRQGIVSRPSKEEQWPAP